MLTGWRISLVAPDGGARLLSTDSGKPVVFDLETPQAAAAALDLSGSNPTRVWMSRSGRGINVQVRLPGGKVYSEDTADLVAATRFEAGGESNHMVVKLPPAKRDETERVLRRYAADWGLDAGDIDTWKEAATQVADESTRTHGTYVLGPAKLGSVTLEVEVAHHVREGEYDVSALFSW
jgi:hypothetical protein